MDFQRIRRSIPFEALLVFVVAVMHLYVAVAPANSLMNWYSTDDAFYYFKTAQNISEGHGVTFDRIGKASGFHPLWMILCIPVFALARVDLVLPLRLLVIISGVLNAGAAVLLFRLLRRFISIEAASLAALIWIFSPHIQATTAQLGMEAGINVVCLLWLLNRAAGYEYGNGTPLRKTCWLLITGLAGALAVLSRLDNIFLVGMVFLWVIFAGSRLRWLILADLGGWFFSIILAFFWRLDPGAVYYQYSSAAIVTLAVGLAVKFLVFLLAGLYRDKYEYNLFHFFLRLLLATSVSSLILGALLIGFSSLKIVNGFPRLILAYDWGITLLLVTILHTWHRNPATPAAGLENKPVLLPDWKFILKKGVVIFSPVATGVSGYMVWNFLYFGTPVPVSGQIKHWWGSLPNTVYGRPVDTLAGFLGFPEKGESPWSLALGLVSKPLEAIGRLANLQHSSPLFSRLQTAAWVLVFCAAFLLLYSNRSRLRQLTERSLIVPIGIGCLLHVISYEGTSYVNTRGWYWVGEIILTMIAGAIILDCLFQWLHKIGLQKFWLSTIIGAIALGIGVTFISQMLEFIPYRVQPGDEQNYLVGVRGLEEETLPGDVIGSTGGGVIAYFIKDRTIVNLDGLMNTTEYFNLLKSGEANQYLDRIGLDYVYGNTAVLLDSDPYRWIFQKRLEFKKQLFGSGFFQYLTGR